jgi:hypothetical protein
MLFKHYFYEAASVNAPNLQTSIRSELTTTGSVKSATLPTKVSTIQATVPRKMTQTARPARAGSNRKTF